ncbi:hypothetical protein CSPX01_04111, partial [Colletotrichum filicis]
IPLDYGGPCDEQVENGPHEGLRALVRALGRTTWRPAAGHGRCSTLHCVRSASEPQRSLGWQCASVADQRCSITAPVRPFTYFTLVGDVWLAESTGRSSPVTPHSPDVALVTVRRPEKNRACSGLSNLLELQQSKRGSGALCRLGANHRV